MLGALAVIMVPNCEPGSINFHGSTLESLAAGGGSLCGDYLYQRCKNDRAYRLMNIPENIKLKTIFSSKRERGDVLNVDFQILEGSRPVGTASLYRINAEEAKYGLYLTCDEYSETFWCGDAIYDYRTNKYSSNLQDLFEETFLVPMSLNVFYLDKLEIDPPYRGKRSRTSRHAPVDVVIRTTVA
jgi:hypothetical protein